MRIFLWISSFPAQAYKLVFNRKWFIVLQPCKMRRVICFYYWHTSVGLHEFHCIRGFTYWLSFQTSVFTTWKYSVEQSSRRAVEFLSYATPWKTAVPLVDTTTTEQHPFDVQPLTWKKSVLLFGVCDTAKSRKRIAPQWICAFFTEACKMNRQQNSKYNVAIVAPRKIASVGEGSQLEGVTRYGLRGHILRVFRRNGCSSLHFPNTLLTGFLPNHKRLFKVSRRSNGLHAWPCICRWHHAHKQ